MNNTEVFISDVAFIFFNPKLELGVVVIVFQLPKNKCALKVSLNSNSYFYVDKRHCPKIVFEEVRLILMI